MTNDNWKAEEEFYDQLTPGSELIVAERNRQLTTWDKEHDAEHTQGELAINAARLAANDLWVKGYIQDWGLVEKHKNNRIDQLVIAGALIAAELDRLLAEAGLNE